MAKLYPPLINGTLPAFSLNKEKGTASIVVPFSYNRAVSENEVASFQLKLKTISGTSVLDDSKSTELNKKTQTVTFIFSNKNNQFVVGQYYKAQMAFVSQGGEIGYYSTVGVIKCTSEPTVTIAELETEVEASKKKGLVSHHSHNYTLAYSQAGGDSSEKLYSAQFLLSDSNQNIIVDSGEILHNVNNDESSSYACESFKIPRELEEGQTYILQAVATTSNGLVVWTPKYHISQIATVDSGIKINLIAENHYDDGYISLRMENLNEDEKILGTFYVSRAASNDNYIWRELFNFSLAGGMATQLWNDFTIEQGVKYKYSIQEYNGAVYSNRIISNTILADFEDAFLFDGKKQLKIRFNPKVSSFKKDIPENKVETIGSKYPFIFRNGNVEYKEFPISGLISYKMDENEIFIKQKTIGLEEDTFNLTSENIFAERNFKLEVLDWLTNGEIKLFKSPTEGNYIVRLLNVSLTPTDSLGRMLHTFQATAYEVSDFTYEHLLETHLLEIKDFSIATSFLRSVSIGGHSAELDSLIRSARDYYSAGIPIIISEELRSRLVNADSDFIQFITRNSESSYQIAFTNQNAEMILDKLDNLLYKITHLTENITGGQPIYQLDIRDMTPGTMLELYNENNKMQTIMIGSTGAYFAKFDSPVYKINVNIEKSLVDSVDQIAGILTYEYREVPMNNFGTIEDYESYNVPCQQFIGPPSLNYYSSTNIIQAIQNLKQSIAFINMVRFSAREIKEIFSSMGKYYWDMDCNVEVNIDHLNPIYLYAICRPRWDDTYHYLDNEQYYVDAQFRNGYYVNKNGEKKEVFTGKYLSKFVIPENNGDTQYTIIDESIDLFKFKINEDIFDIRETKKYNLNDLSQPLNSIIIAPGVICEIGYHQKVAIYAIESQAAYEQNFHKRIYETKCAEWEAVHKNVDINNATNLIESISNESRLEREIKVSYNEYIHALGKTLEDV